MNASTKISGFMLFNIVFGDILEIWEAWAKGDVMELVGVGGSWWELVWVLGGEEIKEERWKNVDGDPWHVVSGFWCFK